MWTGQMGQSLQECVTKYQRRNARNAFLWYPPTMYNLRRLKHFKTNHKNSDLQCSLWGILLLQYLQEHLGSVSVHYRTAQWCASVYR